MAIFDIFSKRQKKLRGDTPDVYVYSELPHPLRVQIVHIWRDALGNPQQYADPYNLQVSQTYEFIVNALCREYGVFALHETEDRYGERNCLGELVNFFIQEEDVEKALDAVELSFFVIDSFTRRYDYLGLQDASERADDAI